MAKQAFQGTVGYIGLGDMGGAIATRLAEAGIDLVVFDVRQATTARLAAKGARTAASLAELAEVSDVIMVCVDPEPQVQRVLDGIIGFLRPRQTVIVQSSVKPQVVIDAAMAVATRGAKLFDAPVSGSDEDRRNGTLAVPTGTSREQAGALHALLELIGRPVYLNILGGGAVAKLANNAVMSLTRTGVIEVTEMARAYGIADADLLDVMKIASAGGFVVDNWSFYEVLAGKGHVLKQQQRQTTEILEVARAKQVRMPMTEALHERAAAIDEGHYRFLTGKNPEFDY